MKVTLFPEQILVAEALTDTVGVILLFTMMVRELDVAVAAVTQDKDEVITQLITSPFTKVAFE